MKTKTVLICMLLSLNIFSCSFQKKTYIVTGEDEQVTEAGHELTSYLSKTYPDDEFELVQDKDKGKRNILLEISRNTELINNEAFQISGSENQLIIQGKTPRALVGGVYGLLKYLGWNYYLSFEVPPDKPKPLDFSDIQIQNAPLKQRRILFNWHNFLSGCTGWNLKEWQQWIDNGSRIGFNTIMVHAYGNNPMYSFSFNGQKKELGYLTTSQKGRDWGTQHVNDVRMMYGGELFKDDEFGSEAAKVPEDERGEAATQLMQQVFKYAQTKTMDVCFALDVDTWMSNPQNIINTLPSEALIEIGGYNTVNPDHPEGKKYYQAQIKQLFSDYPEIDILSIWMRRPSKNPGLGSIWLLHDSSTLPEKWRKEYFEILDKHPELEDEHPYPGLFAISKIVKVFRTILDETRPDVELTLGSWETDFTEQADPFIPEYCGFIPLDYSKILDKPEVKIRLKSVGKNRKLYPVVWAHHDDHRYIGRPYIPYSNFNELLDESNASGYGIIHWTTHPLDLLFNNYENQVWENSENETWEKAATDFSESLLKKEDKPFHRYNQLWFNEAPMFGRETSDFFLRIDNDFTLEGYVSSLEVVKRAKNRLAILQDVDIKTLNAEGIREYDYQSGMEQLFISFFTNHHYGHAAFTALRNGKLEEALSSAKNLKPEESIELYAKTIEEFGATRGEEGLLISLNLRWLPDYLDIKQRTGLEPVRINFQPTSHDSLAQGPGNNTFFVDKGKKYWISLGEKEVGITCKTNGNWPLEEVTDSWLTFSEEVTIPLKTMRNYDLSALNYEMQMIFNDQSAGCQIQVIEDGRVISDFSKDKDTIIASGSFETNGKEVLLKIIPENGIVKLAGLQIRPD